MIYNCLRGTCEERRCQKPPCCFKCFNMDFMLFAQLLAKEGTLRAVKTIKEVFHSNPGRPGSRRNRKKVSFLHNLPHWLACAFGCSNCGHLTPVQQMVMSPGLCFRSRRLSVSLWSNVNKDVDEVVARPLLRGLCRFMS